MKKAKFTVSQCKLRFLYKQKMPEVNMQKNILIALWAGVDVEKKPRHLYSKTFQSMRDLQSEVSKEN